MLLFAKGVRHLDDGKLGLRRVGKHGH